jgi:hypothetical protein
VNKVSVIATNSLYIVTQFVLVIKMFISIMGKFFNSHYSFADSGFSNNFHILTVSVEQMNLQIEGFWRSVNRNCEK